MILFAEPSEHLCQSYMRSTECPSSYKYRLTHTIGLMWRGGLVVGRRTCDPGVAGSRPGRDAAAQRVVKLTPH